MAHKPTSIAQSSERYTGLADVYDACRPSPPPVLADILTQVACCPRPHLVVDLGSGTGLSSRLWLGRADEVVGVEPNPDMRRKATERLTDGTCSTVVSYVAGTGDATGLPDACADIVTCAQAFHWMEPEPTLAEVARILRPEGLFAIIDYDGMPVLAWEADVALSAFMARVGELGQRVSPQAARRPKKEYLAAIRDSGHFQYARELLVHAVQTGTVDRLVGGAMSHSTVGDLLQRGMSEDEIGLTALREQLRRVLGDGQLTWYFGYRVRVGIRAGAKP